MLLHQDAQHNTAGLIAWYRFGDGTTFAMDSSGNPSRMAAITSAVPTNGPFDGNRGALLFPAAGNALALTNHGTLTEVTVCCWIKPNVTSRGDVITVWQTGSTAGDQFNLLYGLAAGKPQFFVSSGSASQDSSTGTGAMTAGAWYHIAGSYKNSGTIKVYLNGGVAATAAGSIILGTGHPIRLGNNIAGDGQFNGALSDVRVYNRQLSDVELMDVYLEAFDADNAFWMHGAGGVVASTYFRRTASPIHTRTGSRQTWAA